MALEFITFSLFCSLAVALTLSYNKLKVSFDKFTLAFVSLTKESVVDTFLYANLIDRKTLFCLYPNHFEMQDSAGVRNALDES